MPLLKSGKRVNDPWSRWADETVDPPAGPLMVSLRQWRGHRDRLLARGTPLGIRLSSEQTPGEIRDDLSIFDLVALDFPVFTDGRSYSNARRLRDRYGFKGEVRATGEVLRDQFQALTRCGFDALEVRDSDTEKTWQLAMDAFSTPYQPATDDRPTVMSLRQRRLGGDLIADTPGSSDV